VRTDCALPAATLTHTAVFRQLSLRLDRKTTCRVENPNTATKIRSPMPHSLASLRHMFSISTGFSGPGGVGDGLRNSLRVR
jgi:hypothetical protein